MNLRANMLVDPFVNPIITKSDSKNLSSYQQRGVKGGVHIEQAIVISVNNIKGKEPLQVEGFLTFEDGKRIPFSKTVPPGAKNARVVVLAKPSQTLQENGIYPQNATMTWQVKQDGKVIERREAFPRIEFSQKDVCLVVERQALHRLDKIFLGHHGLKKPAIDEASLSPQDRGRLEKARNEYNIAKSRIHGVHTNPFASFWREKYPLPSCESPSEAFRKAEANLRCLEFELRRK